MNIILLILIFIGTNLDLFINSTFAQSPRPLARQSAEPLITSSELDDLTTADREAVYKRYTDEAERCTEIYGRDKTCGVIKGIAQGDKTFNNQLFSHIPRPTAVHVITECDPQYGMFFTKVYYKKADGQWANFKSPMGNPGKNTVDTTGEERWLTSPGLYNYEGSEATVPLDPKKQFRTPTGNFYGEGYITAWHTVSDNYDYAGVKMPWAVWVDGSVAYHASIDENVTGYPESHGCLRLQSKNAYALFSLVRIAGTSNTSFHFKGYGETNPQTGKPYCDGTHRSGPILASNDQNTPFPAIQTKSTKARNNIFSKIGNYFSNTRATGKKIIWSPTGEPVAQ